MTRNLKSHLSMGPKDLLCRIDAAIVRHTMAAAGGNKGINDTIKHLFSSTAKAQKAAKSSTE
jgi:hypothetical protein